MLVPFELEAAVDPLPRRVADFVASARTRIAAFFADPAHATGFGFVPSEYDLVGRTLRALLHAEPDARRFCEWGSGFGVVVGMAALLGYEASGIEIERKLVTSSRDLLATHGLACEIAEGSFVPEGDLTMEEDSDLETRTVLGAADGYAELSADPDDFDVVFAYPWPTEEELYCELFDRHADVGARLLTYSRLEGMRCYRKRAATGRSSTSRRRAPTSTSRSSPRR